MDFELRFFLGLANRRLLNAHQAAEASFKVSFTHLIAWAVVRALARHPAMSAAYGAKDSIRDALPPDLTEPFLASLDRLIRELNRREAAGE